MHLVKNILPFCPMFVISLAVYYLQLFHSVVNREEHITEYRYGSTAGNVFEERSETYHSTSCHGI